MTGIGTEGRAAWMACVAAAVLTAGCEGLGRGFDADGTTGAPDGGSGDGASLPDTGSGTGVAPGGDCEPPARCADGAACVVYGHGRVCSVICTYDPTMPFCADGAFCYHSGAQGIGVCLSYGLGAEGAACNDRSDCQAGLACVATGAGSVCVHACDFNETRVACPAGRDCQLTTGGMDYGLCGGGPWTP